MHSLLHSDERLVLARSWLLCKSRFVVRVPYAVISALPLCRSTWLTLQKSMIDAGTITGSMHGMQFFRHTPGWCYIYRKDLHLLYSGSLGVRACLFHGQVR